VTDLAILRRSDGEWRIEQIADGFTAEEIQSLTELQLAIPSRV
jgi:acyl CoA:acetate/3-ketoacid CoA transferase beta subunit